MPRPLASPLNLFGRWIAALCNLYGIESISALAGQAGVNENTLTQSMREGGSGPSLNTVEQLWTALEALAQGSPLRESLPISKFTFYNIAGYSTMEQQEIARLNLIALEYFARDKEADRKREEHIQRLEKDIERLSRRRRPRTSSEETV